MKLSHTLTLVIILSLFFTEIFAACPNACSKRGKCNPNTNKCICPNGWYGEDCSRSIQHVLPGPFLAFRIVNGIFFFLAIVLAVVIIIAKRRRGTLSVQNLSFSRSQNAILAVILWLAVTNFMMHTVDPFAMLGNYPYPFYRIMFASNFPALVTLFSVIIFHWANIYHSSIKLLRDNEKLRKINQNYKGEITIQEVIEKGAKNVRILRYIKIFLVILNFLTWSLQLIREVLLGLKIVTMKTRQMQLTWLIWLLLCYAIQTVGIIYYTPRLLSIMPDQIKKKMRRITRTMIIMSVLFVCSALIMTVTMNAPVPSAGSFLAGDWCLRIAILFILFTMLSFFMKIHKRFPYIVIMHSHSKGSTSNEVGMQTGSHNSNSARQSDAATNDELSFM